MRMIVVPRSMLPMLNDPIHAWSMGADFFHDAIDVDVGAQELHQNRALGLAKAPYNIAVKRHNDFSRSKVLKGQYRSRWTCT